MSQKIENMRNQIAAVVIAFLVWPGIASAQTFVTNTVFFSPNSVVPDGDPNGLALGANMTDINGGIASLTVTLNISGGDNSDLFAYLTGPTGNCAILLNRVGMGSANPSGYDDSGFDITLSDSATYNIHNYQSGAYTLNDSGQLTGDWIPDGRNIDPQSAASSFDSVSITATFESFLGTDPNGQWTLYFADLSGGGQSIVQSSELNITTTPEPCEIALFGFGGILFFAWRRKGFSSCQRQSVPSKYRMLFSTRLSPCHIP